MARGADITGLFAQVQAGVKSVAATALQSVTEITRQVNALTRSFVEAIRPDVVSRFDRASRDLVAVVGQFLVPVMERATVIVRKLGDTLDGIYRNVKDVIDGGFALLDQVFKTVGDAAKQLAAVYGDELKKNMTQLLEAAVQLAPTIGQLVAAIVPLSASFMRTGGDNLKAVLQLVVAASPILTGAIKLMAAGVAIATTPLRLLSAGLKIASDLLSPLVAQFSELLGAFDEIGAELGELAGDLLAALVDLLKELAKAALTLLAPLGDLVVMLARTFVSAVKEVVTWIRWAVNALRELTGLPRRGMPDAPGLNGNSTGKAVVGANFTTADELWKRVALSTASQGRNDPVQDIRKDVGAIRNAIDRMADAAAQTAANTKPKPPDHKQADQWRVVELRGQTRG